MKVKIPTNKTKQVVETEKSVVLDLRFRDAGVDPTAPVVIHHGMHTQVALARLGNTQWKKVQHFKYDRPNEDAFDQYHTISKEGTGIVLFMESEAHGKELPTVRKITMYAALDLKLFKKLKVVLPNGNERIVKPRAFPDLKRPSEILLIEVTVTNIVEKMLATLTFHSQPGREAHGLVLDNWCGKRWGEAMFIPEIVARKQASVQETTTKRNIPDIGVFIVQQSESAERKMPGWLLKMINTDEYHAFRNMRSKKTAKTAQGMANNLRELSNKFSKKKAA